MSVNWDDFTPVNPPAQGGVNWDDFTPIEPKKRVAVPDMTVGSVAQDIAAGALQIGPTAVKGVADIARLATGDRVGKDTSEALERGMGAIRDMVGSDRAAAQRANFQADMADDDVGIGETLARNKGALADQVLPTIGSMFLPVGVAGAAGKLATAGKAAQGMNAAALAARVAAVQKAAGIGTVAAQNAADTFAELLEKGAPMEDAYIGAGITVPFSVVAGVVTGGGAEGAITRALTGATAARAGIKQAGKAMAQEGGQEMGEEAGQIVGEAVGTGTAPSATSAAKQMAVAGTLGAVMGGGVDVANQAGQFRQEPEQQPAPTPAQSAPAAQAAAQPPAAAAPAVAPAQPTQTAAPAAPSTPAADPVARLAELEIISEQRDLAPVEQQEIVTLQSRLNDEQDVPQGAQGTNGAPTDEGASTQTAPDQAAEDAGGNAPAADGVPAAGGGADVQATGVESAPGMVPPSVDHSGIQSSWVVLNKETGDVLFETFDEKKVRALNAAKYQAVPVGDYLGSINGRPKPPDLKDFWSFARSKGFTPGQIKVGTAEHAALKAEYDTLKGSAAPVLPPLEAPQDVNMQNRDRGRAASVVQMSDIARNPDYMRLGPSRTPDSGAPMVFAVGDDLKDIAPDAYGREDVAVMSDGQRVPFRYAVVDATKVNPSNFADGRRNELFDSTAPGTLKALNNGRTAGIRGAHELGTAGEYVQAMQADTPMHGISPDIIARTPNAALVRVYSDSDNTAGMAAKSQGQGLGMSPAELARQDAPLMDSSVLAVYQPGEVTSAANRDFVRAFIGKLQGAGQDVAGMMTADGQLSQDGRKRIQAALMQAAYGDSDIVEEMFDSTDTDIKAIGEALKTVAGQWANMRDSARLNAINPQADITDNLLQAIGLIRKARRDGMSLFDLVNQPDLMTGETPAEMTVGMLRLFYSGQYLTRAIGKEKLTQHLADYVQGAMTTSADAGMFGDVVTAGDILATIVNRLNEGQGNAEAQPQEGRGQPAGSVDTGRSPGEGQPGIGGQAAGEGGPGSNQDRGGQPGQNAQAQAQQQDGQGNQGGQEGNGAQAAAAPGGQRSEPEAQATGVRQPAADWREQAAKRARASIDANVRRSIETSMPVAGKAEGLSLRGWQDGVQRRVARWGLVDNATDQAGRITLVKGGELQHFYYLPDNSEDRTRAIAAAEALAKGDGKQPAPSKKPKTGEAKPAPEAAQPQGTAEQAIRDAFRALPNVALGEFYPITVQHNGREQQFLASQRAIKRGDQPHAALTLLQIRQGRMIAGDDLQDIAHTYKLSGKNELTEESVKPASDGQIKRWSEAFAPAAEPEPLLTAQTPEEIVARQDAAEAAKREQEAADRKAREQERQAEERKRIAQASERAADNFELGQDPLDSLTGQTNIFGAQAEPEAQADDGITIKPGKGLIKGKFLAEMNGDGVPGGPWDTEAQARTAAEAWKQTTGKGKVLTGIVRTDLLKDKVQTPEFKRWFGNSKVVDADGKPLVVYHGTNKTFDVFDANAARSIQTDATAQGFYLTRYPEDASGYATGRSGRDGANVLPVFVSLQNPYVWPSDDLPPTRITAAKRDELESQGYDGIIYRDGEEVVAFRPEQIKSAIGNNGDFDPANPDIRFSRSKAKEIRNLVTLHNLTDENLRYADSMGGIPVPSIGITKVDSPFSGFGGITLIAPKEMVNPESGVPVFDRDAWTARFPEMNFKKPKRAKADAFYERMKAMTNGLGVDEGNFLSNLWESMVNASVTNPDKVADHLRRYDAARMAYARDVLGKNIKVPMRSVPLSSPAANDKQLQAYWKKNGQRLIELEYELSGSNFSNTPEYKSFVREVEGAVRRYAEASGKPERADAYVSMFLPDGELGPGGFGRLSRDFAAVGKKEVDALKLRETVRKVVPDNDPAYLQWVSDQVKPLFDAPTITLRGKEVEPTLDNIVDAMTVGATAGVEKSMTFGPGKLAAHLGKQFKSMAEIKAARDQVVSESAETESKKATDAILDEYRSHIAQFFKFKDWRGNIDTWAANDSSMEALARAGKQALTDANIRAALSRKDFKGVDQRGIDLARQAIEALRSTATNYFEAKPQRAVRLNEFSGAVVPKGVSPESVAILEKNGIAVEFYGKADGAREKAIEKLAKRLDRQSGDVLFSKQARTGTMTAAAVNQVADTIAARWDQPPPVVVVQSMQDMRVPEAARLEDARQRAGGASGSPRGFYYRGQVYLVADGLTSVRDAAETLFHEALGHHGLRAMFGKDLDGILDQIAMARPDLMKPKAEEYGKDLKVQKQRREVAEEVLAEMAQTKPELGYVKRAIAAIRTWLRQNVPGFKDLQLTDAEIIRSYILPARGWVERGAQSAQPEIAMAFDRSAQAADQTQTEAFKRWFKGSKAVDASGKPLVVYHGTGADFSVFTRDRAGATSGAANAGMGFFFTDQPEVAGRYAAMSGGAQSVMPVYLSLQNPIRLTAKNMMEADRLLQSQMKPEHDGAIIEVAMRDGGVQTVFMAKESSQVKSSTGNNGGFDPANPDIRFSRSTLGNAPAPLPQNPTPLQKLKAKALQLTSPQAITNLIYEYQDKNIDLKRLRDHIKELGGTITDLNDAYLGEELYHKRLAKRTQDFLSEELKPLLADLRARGLDLPTLEQFLHARHAPEANKVLAERNPNAQMIDAGRKQAQQAVRALELQLQRAKAQGTATKAIEDALTEAREEAGRWKGAQAFKGTEDERTSLSGMSDAAAKAFMDGLQPGQRVHLDALAARVDAINAKTLDTLEKYGLMDKASMDAWRNTYQHYVPLHRDEAHPDAVSHPIGQGFSTKGAASKRRTGSNEKVTNILAHIAMQRESALTRGEKNRVAKKLYLMAAQNPDPEVWAVDKPPMTKTVDSETGFVRTNVDPTYKNKPNVVMVRISGKDQAIVFNERNPEAVRLAQSIKNQDVGDLGRVMRASARFTRFFAAMSTQYNPVFTVVNFVRDLQGGVINLSSTQIADRKKQVFMGIGPALRAIYADVRAERKGGAGPQNQWAQLWEEMQNEGGTTGYRDLFADPAERVKAIEKELAKIDRGDTARLVDWYVTGWVSDMNEAVENAVRLSAYKAARDSGMSKEQSASLAKNITVNFNRKGRLGAHANALYAFFNAAVQGNTRMLQTLSSPMGRKIILGGIALGVLNTMLMVSMLGGDGEDDEYKNLPEFVKSRNLMIPLGGKDYVTVPLPLGLHVLPNIGRLATEFAMGYHQDKGLGGVLGEVMTLVMDAFNPLGGSENVAMVIAPTPLDIPVGIAMNRDWQNRPIARENMSELDPEPAHKLTRDSATIFSKKASELLNAMGGGDEYTPGAKITQWTPDQLDYVVSQLTGGLGREVVKSLQTINASMTGDELPDYKIPLWGRFKGSTEGPAGQSMQYSENVRKLNIVENSIKGRARDEAEGTLGDNKTASEYMADEPLSDLVGVGNAAERQIAKLRQYRASIQRRAEPGYQDEVKQINEQIAEVMTSLNREVNRVKKEAATN